MATDADYATGKTAAMTVINDFESRYVPGMFQPEITETVKESFADALSHAIADAVDAGRAENK